MRKTNPFQHGISNILLTFIGLMAGFVSVRIFVKTYSFEEYGAWVLVSGILTWYIAFDFGLTQSFQNFAVKYRVSNIENKQLRADGFWASTLVVTIIGVLSSLFVFILFNAKFLIEVFGVENRELAEKLVLPVKFFVIISFLASSFRISGSLLRSLHFSKLVGYQNLLRSLTPLFVVTLCNYFDWGISFVFYIVAVLFFVIEGIFFYLSLRVADFLPFPQSVADLKKAFLKMANPSFYFFIYQLGFHSIQISQIFLIANFDGAGEAGRINPTLRIAGIISGLVAIGLGPFIAHFNEYFHLCKRKEIAKLYDRLLNMISFLAIICIGGMALTGQFIIRIWVGQDFVYSNNLYVLMGIIIGANIGISYFATVLVGLEMQKLLAAIYTTVGFLFISFAIFLMPSYGLIGLIYIMASTSFILALILWYFCRYNIKNNFVL